MADDDVLARIALVQQSVQAVKRTAEGYGYKYATLHDVWRLVKSSMCEHGLGWTAVCSSEIAGSDDMPAVYNTLTVAVFMVDHERENLMDMVQHGEALSSSYVFPASTPQQVGSCETYYRRYGLLHLLGLTVVADDDGGAAVSLPHPNLTEEFN